jgi:hypothetical protein
VRRPATLIGGVVALGVVIAVLAFVLTREDDAAAPPPAGEPDPDPAIAAAPEPGSAAGPEPGSAALPATGSATVPAPVIPDDPPEPIVDPAGVATAAVRGKDRDRRDRDRDKDKDRARDKDKAKDKDRDKDKDPDKAIGKPPDGATDPGPAVSPPTGPAPAPDGATAATLTRDGTRLFVSGRLQEAKASFEQAIKRASGHAPAYRGLGMVKQRLGDNSGAASAFRKYLQLSPKAADAAAIRARLEKL